MSAPDPIITAINRQRSSCCLFALRIHMRRAGKWSGELHGPAFDAKTQEIEAYWK
ncbi:hypothetical protein [Leisingera methylohalidivorans]|uniref:Uncharacterized protein n=1 Tax=Leisingera methylohalidivorans DSM 14336 TaxID=999552 RepID=V9VZY2_9RHOB|nr:hypothetical protein [Leisingera methylohalidivorans]AHD02935.1 hypothetical protein METH_06755 [Leisingera methylohalidivorans DSM 14336]